MCTPEVTIPALPLEFHKLIDYTFLDTLKLYFIKNDIFYLFFDNFILIYDISYLDPPPSQCPLPHLHGPPFVFCELRKSNECFLLYC